MDKVINKKFKLEQYFVNDKKKLALKSNSK